MKIKEATNFRHNPNNFIHLFNLRVRSQGGLILFIKTMHSCSLKSNS